jgi:hypothetical protein
VKICITDEKLVILHFVEWALMYLTLPETKQRSVEELDAIFNARRPVKASLEKHEVIVTDGKGIDFVASA